MVPGAAGRRVRFVANQCNCLGIRQSKKNRSGADVGVLRGSCREVLTCRRLALLLPPITQENIVETGHVRFSMEGVAVSCRECSPSRSRVCRRRTENGVH